MYGFKHVKGKESFVSVRYRICSEAHKAGHFKKSSEELYESVRCLTASNKIIPKTHLLHSHQVSSFISAEKDAIDWHDHE